MEDAKRCTRMRSTGNRAISSGELGSGMPCSSRQPATDLVLTANGSPTANLLSRTNGWTALYQDTYALMFVREGFPGLTQTLANSGSGPA